MCSLSIILSYRKRIDVVIITVIIMYNKAEHGTSNSGSPYDEGSGFIKSLCLKFEYPQILGYQLFKCTVQVLKVWYQCQYPRFYN